MSLEGLISTYGYAAIGIGTFIEGETILVLGGFAAHRGYLDLPWVIIWGFLGTVIGDQLYFYMGRIKGKRFIEKRPQWKANSDKVLVLLNKHHAWVILGFRFMYGLRTVTPFLIGASNVSPLRFLILNLFGAALWSVTIGLLGYLFGDVLELTLGNIKKYELLVYVFLTMIGATIWFMHFYKHHTANKSIHSTSRKQRNDDWY